MSRIKFYPRWKEELVARSNEGALVFELTMGQQCVYFPSQNAWIKSTPEWARQKWEVYLKACQDWCAINNIPIKIVDDGIVYDDKKIL